MVGFFDLPVAYQHEAAKSGEILILAMLARLAMLAM
jgi:hypothetical protein